MPGAFWVVITIRKIGIVRVKNDPIENVGLVQTGVTTSKLKGGISILDCAITVIKPTANDAKSGARHLSVRA